jgi:hypothetical protein
VNNWNFIKIGWYAIGRIASDFAIDDYGTDDDEPKRVDPTLWCTYAFNIPERLEMDLLSAEWGFVPSTLIRVVYERICASATSGGTWRSGDVPTGDLARELLLTKSMTNALTLLRQSRTEDSIDFDRTDPASIARAGFHEILSTPEWNEKKAIRGLIRGLALVGIGFRGWTKSHICEYCYRIAALGKKYCNEHVLDHSITLQKAMTFNQDVKHKIGRLAARHKAIAKNIEWKKYRNNIFLIGDTNFRKFVWRPTNPLDWRNINPQDYDKNDIERKMQNSILRSC